MRRIKERQGGSLKKIILAALLMLAMPTAVFAAVPDAWIQRYDITIVEPGGVANYIQRYRINIVDPVHLSLTTNNVNIAATPNAATPDTGKTVATVTTAWATGYSLRISGDVDLVCLNDETYTIPALTADGDLATNTWGYGLGADTSTPPTTWKGVTAAEVELAGKNAPSAGLGDPYNVFFGTRVDAGAVACEYVGEVVFTALAN